MHRLAEDDLAIQATARSFADELIPLEVEVELADGEVPAGAAEARITTGRSSSGCSRRTSRPSSAGAAARRCSRCSCRSRAVASPTRSAWVLGTPPSWLPAVATPYQRRRWVDRPSAARRVECYAITEERAGSDVADLAATARRDGDDYVLNGEKWHVTSYNEATYAFFQARLVGGEHAGEHAMFFVDLPRPGVRVVRTPAYTHTHRPPPPDRRVRRRAGPGVPPDRRRGRRHDVRLRVVPVRAADGRGAMPRRGRPAGRGGDRVRAAADRRRPAADRLPAGRRRCSRTASPSCSPRGRLVYDVARADRRRRRPQGRRTRSARWPSSTPRRWPAGSPTARCRCSAGAATCARTSRSGSSASCASSASGRARASCSGCIIAGQLAKRGLRALT